MARPAVTAGGGFAAIFYVLRKAYVLRKGKTAGYWQLWRRLRSRNACKTCALGMGGQQGGMVNEAGRFPEVCKKSIQAQVADMQGGISEETFQRTSIQAFRQLTSRQLEALGRLTFPVCAAEGDLYFRRISWEQAIAKTAMAFREANPREVFFYSSGRCSNEAAFLMQLVARAYGTANIHNCSYYCHQASGVALNQIYGSGTSSIVLDDLDHADLAVVVGANPASNHPRLIRNLVDLRRRGGKVLVINPMKELGLVRFRLPSDIRSLLFGSKIADLYLQPHVGTDVALFHALLKGLIDENALDAGFIEKATTGFDSVKKELAGYELEQLLSQCGIPQMQYRAALDLLKTSKAGVFLWAMGLTHHLNGVDNVLALGNLALARGFLGKPGSGLLPIRGHSNVQGVGSCGVAPELKKAFALKMKEIYSIGLPEETGLDTYASMVAATEGKIRAAFLLGGNLFASNPDRAWAAAALQNIPFTCTVSTKLNEGHFLGKGKVAVILPALARDEESQTTSQESMFNFVRLSDGGKPNVQGSMRSEVEIMAQLAENILPQHGFRWGDLCSHEKLREKMAQIIPGFGKLAELSQTRAEFQIQGRTFHEPRFATADQKARFHAVPLPEFHVQPDEFRLMTLRSEGQFNSVVYEEEDIYRGNKRRDVVMMADADAKRLQLQEGDRVIVSTQIGQMTVSAAIVDIPPGNLAMYYPEANALVPRKIDPRSKTPAFKSVAARVCKAIEPATQNRSSPRLGWAGEAGGKTSVVYRSSQGVPRRSPA